MGKSTWTTLVERLNDEEYMQSLGGTIPVTESLLKKYKKRSERSAQGRCWVGGGAGRGVVECDRSAGRRGGG